MGRLGLASVDELYDTIPGKQAFEEHRRSMSLVDLAESVRNRFTLREVDWSSPFSYIIKHWDVVPVLVESPGAIREVFGEVHPILDLITDPEEGWEELFIVIPTRESVSQALERLRQLDARWFANAARRAHFAINVTIDRDV